MSKRFGSFREFRHWNEEMAHKYDPEFYHLRSNVFIRWLERRRVRTLVRFLNSELGDRVLEVGCGAGNVLERIGAVGSYGFDLSYYLLRKSQARLAHYKPKLVMGDAACLPFADGQFERIVCTEVLEHVINPRKVVKEIARVLAPDGVVVISIPNECWIDFLKSIAGIVGISHGQLHQKSDRYYSPTHMTDEWHLHAFDLRLLEEITDGVFIVQKCQGIPWNWLPLRYVVEYYIDADLKL